MRKWAFPCNICNVDRLSGKGTLKSLNYVRTSFEQWKIPRNNLSIRTRTRLNWGFKCFSVKRRRINKNIKRICKTEGQWIGIYHPPKIRKFLVCKKLIFNVRWANFTYCQNCAKMLKSFEKVKLWKTMVIFEFPTLKLV